MARCLPQFFKQSKATNYFSLIALAFTCSTSFSPFLTFSHLLLPFLFLFSSCLYRSETSLSAEIAGFRWYGRYEACTANIFSGTKQGVYLYRCTDRYGIYRPYRPIRYGIDFLVSNTIYTSHQFNKTIFLCNMYHFQWF